MLHDLRPSPDPCRRRSPARIESEHPSSAHARHQRDHVPAPAMGRWRQPGARADAPARVRRAAPSGRQHLDRERPGHTLQTTALVHEAYLRWWTSARCAGRTGRTSSASPPGSCGASWWTTRAGGRGQARRRPPAVSTMALGGAGRPGRRPVRAGRGADRLAALDPQQARVVELRFFGGLAWRRRPQVLGVSAATVKRDWRSARAWLYRQVDGTE